MMRDIVADFDRLKNQIDIVNNSSDQDDHEIRNMAYEYLCVAIVGRLEQNIKTILVTYANNKSERRIGSAVTRLCQNFQNPSKDKIIDLISLFDKSFADRLKQEWSSEDSLGNIISDMVGKRKIIAHQTNNNRDVTRTKINTFYKAYKSLIIMLDAHFLK